MAKALNITASTQLRAGGGNVYGFIVNSHTSGTLKFWDSLTATGTVIMNTYTFPTGSSVQLFPAPVQFTVGLFATVGGTVDITPIWDVNS